MSRPTLGHPCGPCRTLRHIPKRYVSGLSTRICEVPPNEFPFFLPDRVTTVLFLLRPFSSDVPGDLYPVFSFTLVGLRVEENVTKEG